MRLAIDGSCIGNPGPGGWAWCTEGGASGSGSVADTTNNRMELQALSEALAATDPDGPIEVISDSQYVVGIFTKWLKGWRANGMRKSDGKPVANDDLVVRIARQLRGRSVSFTWVRGHSGHPLNEKADRLARAAAEAEERATNV